LHGISRFIVADIFIELILSMHLQFYEFVLTTYHGFFRNDQVSIGM